MTRFCDSNTTCRPSPHGEGGLKLHLLMEVLLSGGVPPRTGRVD